MIKPRENLLDIVPYRLTATQRKEKTRLDLNENMWGCSPKVLQAIKNIQLEDVAVYPEYQALKQKIADFYNLNPEAILVTNGADDGIRCFMDTYVEKDDEIILPIPGYSMYEIFSKVRGAKMVKVLYHPDFSFPTEGVLNAITTHTRAIVIVNPANPLGTSISKEDFTKILRQAKNAMILVDETYCHFARSTYAHWTTDFDNLVIVQTFSKVFGLAGLRLGCIISHSQNIENLIKIHPPFSVNAIALIAGQAALDDTEHIEHIIRRNAIEKDYLYQELKKLGLEVRMTDTNFLLANFGKWSNEVHQKLITRDILVRNMSGQPLLNGYLRITVGTRKENSRLLEALKEIIPPEATIETK